MRTKGVVRRNTKSLKKRLFGKSTNDAAVLGSVNEHNEDMLAAYNDLSLNAPLNDSAITHQDVLKDERPDPMRVAQGKQQEALVKRDVASALAILNPKERLIIEKRVMADEPESLQGLGTELGLTRERVRQIEAGAMKKLKACLASVSAGNDVCCESA